MNQIWKRFCWWVDEPPGSAPYYYDVVSFEFMEERKWNKVFDIITQNSGNGYIVSAIFFTDNINRLRRQGKQRTFPMPLTWRSRILLKIDRLLS